VAFAPAPMALEFAKVAEAPGPMAVALKPVATAPSPCDATGDKSNQPN
jgi:hypothetical protein